MVVAWNKTHPMRLAPSGLCLHKRVGNIYPRSQPSCVPMIAASLSPLVGLHFVSICYRFGGHQMIALFLRQLLIFE
jgi:hypothetical protein